MTINKPIIFFDLETTGLDVQNDKIVQIGWTKIDNEGIRETRKFSVNPERPISKEASDVHGITDEMVKDLKPFRNYAQSLYKYFYGCDLAGFNSDSFDIPLLAMEFQRAGIIFPDWNPAQVDVLRIHKKLNPQTLADLYEYYAGGKLENAHDAGNDVAATEAILSYIMKSKFSPETTPNDLDEFVQGDRMRVDTAGKLYKDSEGVIRWNFTDKRGQPVLEHVKLIDWCMKQLYIPEQTKQILREIQKQKS